LFERGLHLQDVICGVLIAGIYLWLGWPFMDMVEEYTIKSRFAPLIIVLSHFLLGKYHCFATFLSGTPL